MSHYFKETTSSTRKACPLNVTNDNECLRGPGLWREAVNAEDKKRSLSSPRRTRKRNNCTDKRTSRQGASRSLALASYIETCFPRVKVQVRSGLRAGRSRGLTTPPVTRCLLFLSSAISAISSARLPARTRTPFYSCIQPEGPTQTCP